MVALADHFLRDPADLPVELQGLAGAAGEHPLYSPLGGGRQALHIEVHHVPGQPEQRVGLGQLAEKLFHPLAHAVLLGVLEIEPVALVVVLVQVAQDVPAQLPEGVRGRGGEVVGFEGVVPVVSASPHVWCVGNFRKYSLTTFESRI